MSAYYNEIDGFAAQWLRNLITAGHIPAGDVDERSIIEVQPEDVKGYTQCHWFAGLGGWAYAARLAGFPDDREIWTGSCPCQPFSVAGKGAGSADDRHLWPEFFRLISKRRPPAVLGEQVAAAVGRHWLDGVFLDLEGVGYACGAFILPACAVDAPHRRDRLWFVADANCARSQVGFGWARNTQQERASIIRNRWAGTSWLSGADGKTRRIKSSIRLLADGVPGRVPKLRALGNAIVPQIAAEVIAAWMDVAP